MTATSEAYLTLLEQVETALDDALDGGKVPPSHSQREELESMRREVSAVRRALRRRETSDLQPVAVAR